MSEQVDDFLIHYGVKGMKWGKRRGGLKERVKSAALDRNHNTQAIAKRALAGKGTLTERAVMAPDRILMGKKRHDKFLNKQLSKLEDREARIKAGKTNVLDKLDMAMNTSVLQLAVSRRDERPL